MKKKTKNKNRICPNSKNNFNCKKTILYTTIEGYNRAIRNNSECINCANLNKNLGKEGYWKNKHHSIESNLKRSKKLKNIPFTEEHKQKISNALQGRNVTWGDKISRTRIKKQLSVGKNNPMYGKKGRLCFISSIDKKYGIIRPWFNVSACKFIDEYGKQNGYNFQHALNGGEFHIKELGYFVDGYDKEKNITIEYYEPHHYRNGKLKVKEIQREKEIIKFLNCKFIRINALNENQLQIEVI